MEIIKKIFSAIPIGHQAAIRKVMESIRKSGEEKTSRELQFDAARLVGMVKNSTIVSAPIFAKHLGKIDSGAHNQNMEGAYIDLKALYVEASHIGNTQKYQKATIESNFGKARAALLKLINDTRIFTLRSRRPEFDDIKLVNFNIARNESSAVPPAIIDVESRLLKLAELSKTRAHTTRRGQKKTIATVKNISAGQSGNLSSQFPPELALDGKTETFWGEIIYSSVPLQSLYVRTNVSGYDVQSEYVFGPIVKYTLNFSSAEAINQIKVLPFAPSAIKILDITYRTSRAATVRYPITGFTVEESLDWIEYNFEKIYAKDIEIVFVQESYREFIVRAPKHILYSTDFFLRLIEERKQQLQEVVNLDSVDIGGNNELYAEAISDLTTLMENKEMTKSPSTEIDLAGKVIMSLGETLAGFTSNGTSLLEDVSNYTDTMPIDIVNKIETIKKYEYVLGAKEIQANHVIYSPHGTYESPKFETNSTVVAAQLEVDEYHPTTKELRGARASTSTEWAIEFSEDRIVPIFPANHVVDGFLPVVGERLLLDPASRLGLSRLPAHMSSVTVRENSIMLDSDSGYTSTWDDNYEGRLQIEISQAAFDENAVYTIDYYAAPSSKEIDVISRYSAKRVMPPDSFENTDSDTKVNTSFYPFINYGIINSDVFQKNSLNDYAYNSPTGAYELGLLEVHPNWLFSSGIVPDSVMSGSSTVVLQTGWVTTGNFDDLNSTYLTEPYRYYLKLQNYNTPFEVSRIVDSDTLELSSVPLIPSGAIGDTIDSQYFIGNGLSGTVWPDVTTDQTGYLQIPYSLHVTYKDGDELFGFDHLIYSPITTLIGGSKAKNITDYENLEQPAFTVSESKDDEYEFIHDGKFIYFNQGILNTEILVDYKKMTDYIKVKCILRSNKIINPNISPQINEYRLFLNTTVI